MNFERLLTELRSEKFEWFGPSPSSHLSTQVHTRRVDASYWSSASVVAAYPSVPGCLVLLGDAACGKPFYTGTTLNGHLQDVVPLVYETNWRRQIETADSEAQRRRTP